METEIEEKIYKLIELGNTRKLRKFVGPYLADEHPLALYAVACTSFRHESEEQFAVRYIQQMTKASEGGIARASYQMGVNHLYGDDVQQDYMLASVYFERAIEQGHSYSKFTYGFSLYYGTDENKKDMVRGLSLMQEAANEGEEKAVRELQEISDASDMV